MGAMQAQDYPMVKWAIGLRLNGFTEQKVDQSFDSGEILRTHLLRPTWHVVSARDIEWFIDLTGLKIKSGLRSRNMELGLTEPVLEHAYSIIDRELSGNRHLTRESLMTVFQQEGLDTSGNRSSHYMIMAELEKRVCSGANVSGKPTYALFRDRVKEKVHFSREESLGKLAKIYFSSHGPATIQDFSWWSGLNAKDSMNGLDQAMSGLISETIGSQTYWMDPSVKEALVDSNHLFLLPAYDEYLISYKDRSATLAPEFQSRAISENGLFRPIMLLYGRIIGTWKRSVKKSRLILEPDFFSKPNKKTLDLFDQASFEFAKFLLREPNQ